MHISTAQTYKITIRLIIHDILHWRY